MCHATWVSKMTWCTWYQCTRDASTVSKTAPNWLHTNLLDSVLVGMWSVDSLTSLTSGFIFKASQCLDTRHQIFCLVYILLFSFGSPEVLYVHQLQPSYMHALESCIRMPNLTFWCTGQPPPYAVCCTAICSGLLSTFCSDGFWLLDNARLL